MSEVLETSSGDGEARYILITECLQNNFFLSRENPLRLEETQALQIMLKGNSDNVKEHLDADHPLASNRRIVKSPTVGDNPIKGGPLYQFFFNTIGSKRRKNHIHVIHIKDWHEPSESYNYERRYYGSHCEAGTWEAESIDGYEEYLKPWAKAKNNPQQTVGGYKADNNATFYEILSNNISDFVRGDPVGNGENLQQILDNLILDPAVNLEKVYVVVIGVLTDIKIKLMLVNLRSRYNLKNLIISDVLCASNTLERHISGLDFAYKVLGVEIVHSLNALVSVLNPQHEDDIPAAIIEGRVNFGDYRNYYLDKQNILSFQDRQLIHYMDLTGDRGAQAYTTIFQINRGLAVMGFAFLMLTFISSIMAIFRPSPEALQATGLLGGISIVQFVAVFFNGPMQRLQKNLTNLVRLRNYLETYSSTSALLRYHMTTPEMLQMKDGQEDNREARLETLRSQLDLIGSATERLSQGFSSISMEMGEEAPAVGAPPSSSGPAEDGMP